MATPPINLNADPLDATVRRRLQMILGPIEVVTVLGPIAYDRTNHLCRMLRLAPGLGEVAITIPAATPIGDAFSISSPSTSWPRLVFTDSVIEHPSGHAAGLPAGALHFFVAAAGVGVLSGFTQL
ncbi:hypothetical protein J2X65_002053 [Ancylobacter sp. 3268]|uniref:hypothetical protein n=1 Tax=Ancylobacter sp. 3268 TaxID=2817752 RepID=UPI0028584C77|nr:hypothetical protein [Ancylobacter sp. 3268]MDR6952694.1 hypothetical protein [Ancylobacter sp. 3268]